MFRFSAKTMIITGGGLLVLSVIIPALRMTKILPASLFYDFLAYIFLVCGLFLGMMGIFTFVKKTRDAHRDTIDRYREP